MYPDVMRALLYENTNQKVIDHLTHVAAVRHDSYDGADCTSCMWKNDPKNDGKPQVFIALVHDASEFKSWMFEASHPFINHSVVFFEGGFPDGASDGDVFTFVVSSGDDDNDAVYKFVEDRYDRDAILSLTNNVFTL